MSLHLQVQRLKSGIYFFTISGILVAGFSSCSDEIRASLDSSYVAYKYEVTYNGVTRTVVSPDADAVGFNVAVSFLTGAPVGDLKDKNIPLKSSFHSSLPNPYLFASYDPSTAGEGNAPAKWKNPNQKAAGKFADNIRFLGLLEFVMKGTSGSNLYYFQAPLYATYWHALANNAQLYGGVGPYLAYGFGKAISGNGGLKPFDAGASAIAGYKIPNSFSFSLNYDLGLANIVNKGSAGDAAKMHSVGFSVGYPISKLIKKK